MKRLLLPGFCLLASLFLILLFPACRPKPQLSPRDLANYAGQITFSNFRVGVSENMANHVIYYIDTVAKNGGNRTITEMTVNASFRDLEGQVVFREASNIITPRRKPLAPGGARDIRMGFEGIPGSWNRAAPALEITHLVLE